MMRGTHAEDLRAAAPLSLCASVSVSVKGDGPSLLLLHGFTGTRRTWDGPRSWWNDRLRTIAVDLIGHGESPAPDEPSRYGMERAVEDLVALLDSRGVARAHVLGYSMGGRVALHLALAAPERVGGIVLESASPGLCDARERRARVERDLELALRIEREGVEAFARRWEEQPLFATQRALEPQVREAIRAERRSHSAVGLANSLRGMGAGAQEPLWDRLPALAAPTLVVSGDLDLRYREIGRETARALPNARHAVVAGAGHAVHLERPEELARLVLGFLEEIEEIEEVTR